jgi:Concanavalin A-like lectin/glucanases superfamily
MRRVRLASLTLLLTLATAALVVGQSPPSTFLHFNGTSDYVEVPDTADFSVATTGSLTISAWMRPDTLSFPQTEGSGYVHWLGKGQSSAQEWVFRMYSQGNTEGRENRISFYVFNASGGLGTGSYFQDAATPGQWIHVVGVADGQSTHIYKNGVLRDSDLYAGTITPQHGSAPLRMGTRDFQSFFQGGLAGVRIWNRALSGAEVAALYGSAVVPQSGLVAEYPLDGGSGAVALDSTGRHPGTITGASFQCASDATDLCLDAGRFRVTVSWQSLSASGAGQAQQLTSDTGYFWFFVSTNVEMVIKVLDGCSLNAAYWVFAGGLTNVDVNITVTDLQTGAVRNYNNAQGTAFQPIQDTSAFSTCP